jgi:hypothetical protein
VGMASLKGRLKNLRRRTAPVLDSFEFEDGGRFYYNPTDATLFVHAGACARAEYRGDPLPEAPPLLRAIAAAKDRRRALEEAGSDFALGFYDVEALVDRGELVPRAQKLAR